MNQMHFPLHYNENAHLLHFTNTNDLAVQKLYKYMYNMCLTFLVILTELCVDLINIKHTIYIFNNFLKDIYQ